MKDSLVGIVSTIKQEPESQFSSSHSSTTNYMIYDIIVIILKIWLAGLEPPWRLTALLWDINM